MECTMQDRIPILERYLDSLTSINPSWSINIVPQKFHQPNTFSDLLYQDYSPTKTDEIHGCNNYEKPLFHEDSRMHGLRPIKIDYSPIYGRYLAASRDIAAGEVIFQEKAMVLAPKAGSGPTCLACLKSLQGDCNVCESCGAPLCSPMCTGDSHTERECSVIARLGLKENKNPTLVKMLNIVLTPLRTLMISQDNTSVCAVVAALQSNMEKRKKLPIGKFIEEHIVSMISSRMKLDIDPEIVHHICGVFDTNAFEVSLSDNSKGRALYPLGSLMNHSCLPNTQHWFKNDIMTVRAVTDIQAGEPVTNAYNPVLLGTRGRTAHLLATKLFKCTCKRCRDPTELGSHISSMACRQHEQCNGLMTPPLDIRDDWTCQNCGNAVSNMSVDIMIRAASSTASRVSLDDTESLNVAINHLSRLLGSQHYITLEMKYALLTAILRQPMEGSTDGNLIKGIDLANSLLHIASLVDPGLSRFRGLLLLAKLKISAEQLLRRKYRHATQLDLNHNDIDPLNSSERIEKISFDKSISHQTEIFLKEADECEQILQHDHKLPEVHQVITLLRELAKGEQS